MAMIKNGQMDDVIAEKVAQRVKKRELITHPNDTRKFDTRTPGQKFDDKIREDIHRLRNQTHERVFGKSKSGKPSSNSGGGRWITINGAHVYLE